MKPVKQTEFGPRGNCMSAALASLLELPLESVPNFYAAGPNERDWHNALKGWLTGLGFALIEVPIGEKGPGAFHWGGYAIASGPTNRENGWHATVWHDGKIVHDPHPDGSGLTKLETLEFLYPLDPALRRAKQFDAMAWGDRIRDDALDELLARAEKAHTVLLRIDQFRDLVQQAKATRPEVLIPSAWPRNVIEAVANALDNQLGDSDITHMDAEELREHAPVQWACSELNKLLQSTRSPPVTPEVEHCHCGQKCCVYPTCGWRDDGY